MDEYDLKEGSQAGARLTIGSSSIGIVLFDFGQHICIHCLELYSSRVRTIMRYGLSWIL